MNLQQITEGLQWYSEIGPDELLQFLKTRCSKNIELGRVLFRGQRGDAVMKYDTSKPGVRTSANSSNYYTLFLDNHPHFKHLPKRSKSLICSTNINGAYGGSVYAPYVVIPEDDAKIALCPTSDIWTSAKERTSLSLNALNNVVTSYLIFSGVKRPDDDLLTWAQATNILEGIEQTDLLKMLESKKSSNSASLSVDRVLTLMNNEGLNTMFEVYEDILSNINFEILGQSESVNTISVNEGWVSGAGILIGSYAIPPDMKQKYSEAFSYLKTSNQNIFSKLL